MAEKGFGVKEVNLIGASGTPTITSPNNLNLNAVNVAISTNVSIGGTLSVTGNVSVGGTLTYEDVTNIDSVGVITARSGVDVDDFVSVGSNIHLGNAGVVTATTFSGSGASLTSIPAGQLTGTVADARISTLTASKLSGALPAISGANLTNLPATDPTNSDIQVVYEVTANGSSAYRFAGNGVVSTSDNPELFLIRGQKYRFINNSGGSHPFQIRVSSGGSAYSTGVTNNGASSGNIDFAPTFDSPALLVYQCTVHGGMVGNIYISDGKYDTKANQPAFRAGRSTDVNPGANGTIVFNYVANPTHFNQGGYYDNSTGAFTAPVAGIYNFYTQVLWENVPDGQDMADCIMLYYNSSGGASGGTLVSYDARRAEYIANETGNAGYYGAFTTLLLYMAANSSIYVRNARNLTVHGNANFTFFQGYLVG